jgi:hypothetical protein
MRGNKKILALAAALIAALAGIAWAAGPIKLTHEDNKTTLDTRGEHKEDYIASGGEPANSTGVTIFTGKLLIDSPGDYRIDAYDTPVTASKIAAIKVTPSQQLIFRPAADDSINDIWGSFRFYGGGVISLDNSSAADGFTFLTGAAGGTYLEDGTLIVGITPESKVLSGLRSVTLGARDAAATLVDKTGLKFDLLKIRTATGGVFAAQGVDSTIAKLDLTGATAFTVSPDVGKKVTVTAYTIPAAAPTIGVKGGELIMSPPIADSLARLNFDIGRGAKVTLDGAANTGVGYVDGEGTLAASENATLLGAGRTGKPSLTIAGGKTVGLATASAGARFGTVTGPGTLAIDNHVISVDNAADGPQITISSGGNLVFTDNAALAAPTTINGNTGGKITVAGGASVDIGKGVLHGALDLELPPRSFASIDAGNAVGNVLSAGGELVVGGGGTLKTTVKGMPRLRMRDASAVELVGDTALNGLDGNVKGAKLTVGGNLTLMGNSLGSVYSGDIDLGNNALYVTQGYQALAGNNKFGALYARDGGRAAALSETAFGTGITVHAEMNGGLRFPHAGYNLGVSGSNLTLSLAAGSYLELKPDAVYASQAEAATETSAAALKVTEMKGAADFLKDPDAIVIRVDLGGLTFQNFRGNEGWVKLVASEKGFANIGISGLDAEDGTSFRFILDNVPPDGYEYKTAKAAVSGNTLYLGIFRTKPSYPDEPGKPADPLPTERVPNPQAIASVAVDGNIVTVTYKDGVAKTYDKSKSLVVIAYPIGKFRVISGGDGIDDSLVFSGEGTLIPAGSKLAFSGTDVGSAITTHAFKAGDVIPLTGAVQASKEKTVLSLDVRPLTKGIYYDISYNSEADQNPVFSGVLARSYLRENDIPAPTPPAPIPPAPTPPAPTPPTPTPPAPTPPEPTPRKGGGGCDAGFVALGLLGLLAGAGALTVLRKKS